MITGGEPLLSPELTLAVIDRLAAGGVGVTLNSNGWFVDEAMAARLGEVPGLHVHVSLDGSRPDIHDASSGVPGSWRRAVAGMHHMLENGIAVHGVHVVTPENESRGGRATSSRCGLSGVLGRAGHPGGPGGRRGRAAGKWGVSRPGSTAEVKRFRERRGERHERARVRRQRRRRIATREDRAPAALLVRPDGGSGSTRCIRSASATRSTTGWPSAGRRIRAGWRSPEITEWADGISSSTGLSNAGLVPYLDDEAELGHAGPARRTAEQRRADRRAEGARARRAAAPCRPRGGRSRGRASTCVRWRCRAAIATRPCASAGAAASAWCAGSSDGGMVRLNPTGATAFDALGGGTAADAVATSSRSRIRGSLDRGSRTTCSPSPGGSRRTGLILPAGARGPVQDVGASVPDLPGVAVGRRA